MAQSSEPIPIKRALIDLGITRGTAAKVAGKNKHNFKIIYGVGLATKKMGFVEDNNVEGITSRSKGERRR